MPPLPSPSDDGGFAGHPIPSTNNIDTTTLRMHRIVAGRFVTRGRPGVAADYGTGGTNSRYRCGMRTWVIGGLLIAVGCGDDIPSVAMETGSLESTSGAPDESTTDTGATEDDTSSG